MCIRDSYQTILSFVEGQERRSTDPAELENFRDRVGDIFKNTERELQLTFRDYRSFASYLNRNDEDVPITDGAWSAYIDPDTRGDKLDELTWDRAAIPLGRARVMHPTTGHILDADRADFPFGHYSLQVPAPISCTAVKVGKNAEFDGASFTNRDVKDYPKEGLIRGFITVPGVRLSGYREKHQRLSNIIQSNSNVTLTARISGGDDNGKEAEVDANIRKFTYNDDTNSCLLYTSPSPRHS